MDTHTHTHTHTHTKALLSVPSALPRDFSSFSDAVFFSFLLSQSVDGMM